MIKGQDQSVERSATTLRTSPLAPLREELEAGSTLGIRRELMALANVNTPDPQSGDRALHLLVEYNYVPGIAVVLRRKADIDLPNIYHRTPLHVAARMGRLNALNTLLDAKANPDTVARDGSRPIFDAIFYNRQAEAVALIQRCRGVVESRNANLETPLHTLATTSGDPEIGKVLVSAGAPLDAQCIDNDTALHLSVENAHEPLTRLLLRAGANTSLVNKLGLTPDLMPPAYIQRDISRCAMLVTHTRWIRQLQRFANNPSYLALMGG